METETKTRVKAAANFDFKVPGWNETKMDGELLIEIRDESFTIPTGKKKRPLMDEVFGKGGLFDFVFGTSSTTTEFESTEEAKAEQKFRGRRFYDATIRVPTYRVTTIHDLFMRTISATESQSGMVPASSYKFTVNCELAPGKVVALHGCFVKQAPFLHTSVIPNSLIVPLSVDYIDAPDGLLDLFAVKEPDYGTRP